MTVLDDKTRHQLTIHLMPFKIALASAGVDTDGLSVDFVIEALAAKNEPGELITDAIGASGLDRVTYSTRSKRAK